MTLLECILTCQGRGVGGGMDEGRKLEETGRALKVRRGEERRREGR